MNDAYTIGLTLALEDGVSAGIATIRRELSALDQAILTSTANLVRLQEMARAAIGAGVTQAGAAAALTRNSAAAAVRRAGLQASTSTEAPAAAIIASPGMHSDVQAAPGPAPTAIVLPSIAYDRPAAPATAKPVAQEASMPAAPVPRVEPATAPVVRVHEVVTQSMAPAATASPIVEVARPAAQPVAALGLTAHPGGDRVQLPAAAAPLPPVAQTIAAPTQPAAKASTRVVAPKLATLVHASGSSQVDRPAAAQGRHSPAPPVAHAHLPRREVAPTAAVAPAVRSTQMAPMAERPRERPAREPAVSAAPRHQAERSHDKPLFGTITIDGVELGRWMADRMAHAASRPPGGGVAFDPRMSPVWAGASVGA